jgi:hypothetical protein
VNEYVAECRREWTRLGVSNAMADEMAAELEADLDEAPSLDEVLGSDAADARAFARRWAHERGVVPTLRRGLRPGVAAALTAFALAAIAGALLMVFASPSHSERFAIAKVPQIVSVGPQRVLSGPPLRVTFERAAVAVTATPPPLVQLAPIDDSGVDGDTVGLVLLIVGLAGFVPLALLASRRLVRREPNR